MSAGVMEYLMDTGAVQTKGQKLEALGLELEALMKDFNKTANFLIANGMRGRVQTKLDTTVAEVEPGMTKQTQRATALGTGVKKAVSNTDTMATEVSSNLSVGKE